MKAQRSVSFSFVIAGLALGACTEATPLRPEGLKECTPIIGERRSSSEWGSSWLDLRSPEDFPGDTKLKLTLGGSARRILVRLLERGDNPEGPVGVLGAFDVPPNRVLGIALADARSQVIQLSVHGANPWGRELAPNNGPALLEAADRCR